MSDGEHEDATPLFANRMIRRREGQRSTRVGVVSRAQYKYSIVYCGVLLVACVLTMEGVGPCNVASVERAVRDPRYRQLLSVFKGFRNGLV